MLLLVTAIGCVWYALVFSKRLVLRLLNLTKLAKSIEGGDVNIVVDDNLLKGDDEFSSLANSFNSMVLSLRSNIVTLQKYNTEIKNSRNRLKVEKINYNNIWILPE